MLSTEAFLDLILPVEGRRCVVAIPEGGPARQRFYDTNAQAVAAILRLDAEMAGTRGAVYHACASYAPGKHRRAEDVSHVQALWLDVDAGEGKPYATAREAAEATLQFCHRAGLPLPLFVRSGVGLHCYWPLERSIVRADWLPYAQGLKQLCQRHGLAAGPERTADAASILRPPGTWHRKGDPLLVVSGPPVEPSSLSVFEPFKLRDASVQLPARNDRNHSPVGPVGLAARLAGQRTLERIDFDALSSRCPQLGTMRAHRGCIPEPTWYACLGVLAKCVDGNAPALAWSDGHPGYSEAETQQRFERASALSGPPTCAHFQSLNDTCGTCAFRGRAVTPLDVAAFESASCDRLRSDDARGPVAGLPELPEAIGDFYHAPDGSLCIKHENVKGGDIVHKISAFPIRLAAVNTGELERNVHSYHLHIWKPHEDWIDVEIGAGTMFSSQASSKLADLGIVIHDIESFKSYMRLLIDERAVKEKRTMSYEQFGWKDDEDGVPLGFLYGTRFYAGGTAKAVSVTDKLHTRSQFLQPTRKGSVEGWREAADALLFGPGSESVAFATLASLAATLMRFQEKREGGAMVALVTRDSASGKTTTLSGAYTIWASDVRGMNVKKKDTDVAHGRILGAMGNLPIIYDEFWNRDPEVMYEEVMMFTGGEDKNRGARDGGLRHNAASWQTILLSASNMSLVGALQSLNRPEAAAFRVLEMPVVPVKGLSPVEAGQLRDQLHDNGGHIGDAFLKALTRPDVMKWVRQQLPIVTEDLYRRGGFGREHRYWMRTLGAVSVAATLATHLKLMSFSPQRIVKWGLDYVHAMKKEGFVKNDDDLHMTHILAQFLNEHLSQTLVAPRAHKADGPRGFTPLQPGFQTPSGMHKLSIRHDTDTGLYTIDKKVLRAWLQKRDVGIREFTIDLYGRGIILDAGKQATLGAGTTLPGGQIVCVMVDGKHPRLTGNLRVVADVDPITKRSTRV